LFDDRHIQNCAKKLLSSQPRNNDDKLVIASSSNGSSLKEPLILTGNKKIDERLNGFVDQAYYFVGIYESLIGLKDVKNAQKSVIEVDPSFFKLSRIQIQFKKSFSFEG
jgi:hypothetical protein